MSPASVKSENELGPVALLPVGMAVITQLSYRAQLPSCQESSTPRLPSMVTDPNHVVAERGVFREWHRPGGLAIWFHE